MAGAPDTIKVVTLTFQVAVGGEADIRVTLKDSNGAAAPGESVSIVTADGLTISGDGLTNASGVAAFSASSQQAGTFRPVFNNVDAGSAATRVAFGEGYSAPLNGNSGPDEPAGIASARTRIGNIRSILDGIDSSQHPGFTAGAIGTIRTAVDTASESLDNYENSTTESGGCKDSIPVTRADGTEEMVPIDQLSNQLVPPDPFDIANEIVDAIRARNIDLNDSTFDPTELDEELNKLLDDIEESLGRGWLGYTSEGLKSLIGPLEDRIEELEEEDSEQWEETSRETSIISIEGVDIKRIDKVTFEKPNGKFVTLNLNHGD